MVARAPGSLSLSPELYIIDRFHRTSILSVSPLLSNRACTIVVLVNIRNFVVNLGIAGDDSLEVVGKSRLGEKISLSLSPP